MSDQVTIRLAVPAGLEPFPPSSGVDQRFRALIGKQDRLGFLLEPERMRAEGLAKEADRDSL